MGKTRFARLSRLEIYFVEVSDEQTSIASSFADGSAMHVAAIFLPFGPA